MSRTLGQYAASLMLLPLLLNSQAPAPKSSARTAAAAGDPSTLPVKRVVLYKNGVGYFEHLGRVHDSQKVTVAFTTGQLNDVLKSLTVLDLHGGRITGVTYGSSAPRDRQFDDLRLPVGEKPSLTEFLGALRGAKIEVRSGVNVAAGRLLSVERKTRISGGATLEVDYISLVGDGGELRTTELSPQFSVRLLEAGLPGKVDRYLDLVSLGREADMRRMTIATEGSGNRSLFVSYISEVPVWKATYRIVLDGKQGQKPLLQGWAIVDNTIGQDWDKVELSLVAGAPQSFIQNLSQPYYSRRPLVPLPGAFTATPQTFQSTLIPGGGQLRGTVLDPSGAAVSFAQVKAYDNAGTMVATGSADEAGNYNLSVPPGEVRLEVESQGFRTSRVSGIQATPYQTATNNITLQVGSVAETIDVRASAGSLETSSASVARPGRTGAGSMLGGGNRSGSGGGVGVGSAQGGFGPGSGGGVGGGSFARMPAEVRAGLQTAAAAQSLGDLFEYKLKEAITIEKNQSALVPIIHANVLAEKVSVWNESAGLHRPQRALWLTNSSGLTLDGGSFSILEEETFAGEGVFEPIRPDERRLISYATDLALNVSATNATAPVRFTRVKIAGGVMVHETEIRQSKTYTFRNADSTPRTVVVEHPVRQGFQLRSEAKPVETTPSWMRFTLPVAPRQTANLVVEEARPDRASIQISSIAPDRIDIYVRDKTITPEIEQALRSVVKQQSVVAAFEQQKGSRDEELKNIYDDQQRLRENLKALKGSAEEKALVQRYTQQLAQQESRIEALTKEITELERQRLDAEAELDRMIESLSFDVKL